jgi:hypothetical protein
MMVGLPSMVDKMGFKDETALSLGMISLSIGFLVGHFTNFEYSGSLMDERTLKRV